MHMELRTVWGRRTVRKVMNMKMGRRHHRGTVDGAVDGAVGRGGEDSEANVVVDGVGGGRGVQTTKDIGEQVDGSRVGEEGGE